MENLALLLELADLDPVTFDEGIEAFNNGKVQSPNPYRHSSAQNQAWNAGWETGLLVSLKFFPTTIEAVEAEEIRQEQEVRAQTQRRILDGALP